MVQQGEQFIFLILSISPVSVYSTSVWMTNIQYSTLKLKQVRFVPCVIAAVLKIL